MKGFIFIIIIIIAYNQVQRFFYDWTHTCVKLFYLRENYSWNINDYILGETRVEEWFSRLKNSSVSVEEQDLFYLPWSEMIETSKKKNGRKSSEEVTCQEMHPAWSWRHKRLAEDLQTKRVFTKFVQSSFTEDQ